MPICCGNYGISRKPPAAITGRYASGRFWWRAKKRWRRGARAEGLDTLSPEQREAILAKYDQWVDLGLQVFP